MAISVELERLLSGWLARAPWRPQDAEGPVDVEDALPVSAAPLFLRSLDDEPGAGLPGTQQPARVQGLIVVFSLGEADDTRRLTVPLTLRTREAYELRPHLIGEVDDLTLGHCFVYDGVADPEFVRTVVELVEAGGPVRPGEIAGPVPGGQFTAVTLDDPDAFAEAPARPAVQLPGTGAGAETEDELDADASGSVPIPAPPQAPPRIGRDTPEETYDEGLRLELRGGQRANSSAVLHRTGRPPVIVKVFRTVEPGRNPAVTVPAALSGRGSAVVPEVLGWLQGFWYDTELLQETFGQLILVSRFLTGSTDAWTAALTAARAAAPGQGSSEESEETPGTGGFTEQARHIGAVVARMHRDLAQEFGATVHTPEHLREAIAGWRSRVEWALARVPVALAPLAAPLRKHLAALAELQPGTLQRVHGGLDLSALLFAGEDTSVVNFSADASGPQLPAEDLVGLLRSIDRAAGLARLERTGALGGDADAAALGLVGAHELDALARRVAASPEHAWSAATQEALLGGYLQEAAGTEDPLGVEPGHPLLRAVLVDRLLSEVVDELRNRPAGLEIPLAALALLLQPERLEDTPDTTGDGEAEAAGDGVNEDAGEASGDPGEAGDDVREG